MESGGMRWSVQRLAKSAVAILIGGAGSIALPAATHAEAPFVGIFPPASPPHYGDNFGMYATLSLPGLTGTMTWTADGNPIAGCIARPVQPGQNICHGDGTLVPGTYQVQAHYSGDGSHEGASSASVEFRILKGGTDLDYTGPTTVAPGQQMTVSATLTRDTPAGPFADQPVTFNFLTSGGSCSDTTDANGLATCTLTAPPSNELLWIRFDGDDVYASSGAQPHINVTAPTTIAVDGPASAPWGQPIAFSMTLTPPEVSGGTIDLTYGSGTAIAGCTGVAVPDNTVGCTATSGLPVGTQQVVGAYSGSGPYAPSTSAPTTINVLRHAVALANTGAATATVGQPYAARATVTDEVTDTPVSGASVTFDLGAAGCTATSNAAGVATCQLTPVAAGAATLDFSTPTTALYLSDSGSASVAVAKASTTTTLTGGSGVYNAPVTLTAHVAPSDGGTVAFQRDSILIPGCESVALADAGAEWTASCTIPSLPIGLYTYEAIYSGSTNYLASTGSVDGTIGKAPTVVAYTGETTATVGGTVILSAALAQSGSAAMAGAGLTFTWAGQQCIATTQAGGAASCTLPVTAVGQTGAVTVQFAGDSNHLSAASAPATITVSPAATTTTVQAPPDLVFTVPFDLVAVVTPAAAGGTVTFTVGASALPIVPCTAIPVALVNGQLQATCPGVQLPPGDTVVGAFFSGSADYAGSTSSPLVVTVAAAPTSVSYAGDIEATVGVPFTAAAFLANVALDPVAIAGHSVSFDWAGMSCSAVTDALGRAECTFTPTAVAQSGPIAVTFAGTAEYAAASNSSTVAVAQGTSQITLTGPASAPFGEPVILTAVVTPPATSGTVAFTVDGAVLAGCEAVTLADVDGDRQATCTTTGLPAGTAAVVAAYSGDVDYVPSSGEATITITPAPTELSYLGAASGTVSEPVVLSARMSALPNGGSLVAGESLDFAVGGLVCTAVTEADGVASCEVLPTDLGQAGEVTVTFDGTSEYAPASATGSLELEPTGTVTTLTSAASVHFGGSASFVATVAPSAGTGAVGFTADGQPIAGCEAVALQQEGGAFTATCSTDALGVGAHSVRAAYTGTPSYLDSTSGPVAIEVTAAPTQLIYTGDTSGMVGSPMAVSANLVAGTSSAGFALAQSLALSTGPTGVPGQTITFRLGDATCSAVTSASGSAACSLTPTGSPSATALQVAYGGGTTYLSVTLDVAISVSPAAVPPSSTPGTTPGSPTLPATGSDPVLLALLASIALVAGLLFRATRRRVL